MSGPGCAQEMHLLLLLLLELLLTVYTTAVLTNNINSLITLKKGSKKIGFCTNKPDNLNKVVGNHLIASSEASMSGNKKEMPDKAVSKKGQQAEKKDEVAPWVKTFFLYTNLTLWYLLSAFYNIYNKKSLNTLNLPWLVATIQMGTGILLFVPLWLLKVRIAPFENMHEFFGTLSIIKYTALFATISHIAGVSSLGLGTVSFTQVVKAAEPIFTAAIAAIFLRNFLSWQSYATMIPIIIGVCISSVSEISFSWQCLGAGVISNIFAGARSVYSKVQMSGDVKSIENISPENYYSLLTILSFLMLIPVTFIAEYRGIMSLVEKSASGLSAATRNGLQDALISGLLFYLYNELSFKVLNQINPVSHALANTIKRVAIILSSVFMFNNPITFNGKLGSAIAIFGAFLYSQMGSSGSKKK